MTRIQDFSSQLGNIVEGQYLLHGVHDRHQRDGYPYKLLAISDASGEIDVYAWDNSGTLNQVPSFTPALVNMKLSLRTLNGKVIADSRHIHQLDVHEVMNAAALLPQRDCPAPAHAALASLVHFNEALAPEVLKHFLNRVLADTQIGRPLLRCKGSQAHHHNQPGGLLIHSIEVMLIAVDMAVSRLSELERAIIQIAALFHDLGKLRAIGPTNVRPTPPQVMRHESQTLRLLEPHLCWLKARSPETAIGLEYILDYLAQSRTDRGYAKFVGAEIIAAADQMSAALDNGKTLDNLLDKTMTKTQRLLAQATVIAGQQQTYASMSKG